MTQPTDPSIAALVGSEEAQYLGALGAFIEAYALFEASLSAYLQKIADIYPPMFSAMFSGLNVKQKQGLIRRIWRIQPAPDDIKEELDEIFKRSLDITDVRNSMLHYGSYVTSEAVRITSDVSRALKESEATEHRVSGDTLSAMNLDILKCGTHLISLALRPTTPYEERALDSPILARAWFYKHEPMPRQKSSPIGFPELDTTTVE